MNRQPVDPFLRELCLEIVDGNVDGERFARLLIETGINIDTFEWDLVNKLLGQGEQNAHLTTKFGNTVQ